MQTFIRPSFCIIFVKNFLKRYFSVFPFVLASYVRVLVAIKHWRLIPKTVSSHAAHV